MKMEPGSSSLGGDRGGGRAQARCSPPPLQAEHEGETHTVQVAPDIKSHLTFSSSPPSCPGFRAPPHPRFLLPQAADLAVSTEAFAAAEHHLVNTAQISEAAASGSLPGAPPASLPRVWQPGKESVSHPLRGRQPTSSHRTPQQQRQASQRSRPQPPGKYKRMSTRPPEPQAARCRTDPRPRATTGMYALWPPTGDDAPPALSLASSPPTATHLLLLWWCGAGRPLWV